MYSAQLHPVGTTYHMVAFSRRTLGQGEAEDAIERRTAVCWDEALETGAPPGQVESRALEAGGGDKVRAHVVADELGADIGL